MTGYGDEDDGENLDELRRPLPSGIKAGQREAGVNNNSNEGGILDSRIQNFQGTSMTRRDKLYENSSIQGLFVSHFSIRE